jgi:hypothetical protein
VKSLAQETNFDLDHALFMYMSFSDYNLRRGVMCPAGRRTSQSIFRTSLSWPRLNFSTGENHKSLANVHGIDSAALNKSEKMVERASLTGSLPLAFVAGVRLKTLDSVRLLKLPGLYCP